MDLQCAFDTVWHDALIHKMLNFGISGAIVKIVQNFLTDRFFTVGTGSFKSHKLSIKSGVPQGSVLGPKLFNIFLADLPRSYTIKILQFADDIIFYLPHGNTQNSSILLNNFLATISNYYKNWKLKLNEDKTQLINFYGTGDISPYFKRKNRAKQRIVINNILIQPVDHIKYLGITFSSNFKFIQHINNIIKKTNIIISKLSHLLRSNFLETKFKLFIYKVYIRPILQYGATVWLNPTTTSSHQVERIRVVERKIIRKTANIRRKVGSYKYLSNKKLYKRANITRIDKFLVEKSIRFFSVCENSENEFLRGIVEPFKEAKYYHPSYVHHLNQTQELFVNDKLLIFHRGTINPHTMVYNTNQ